MKPQMTMMKKTSTKGVNINIRSHYNDGHFWKVVRRNSPPSYFFGTIHIPAKFVWDIVSTSAKEAFKNADAVYTEIDTTKKVNLDDTRLLPDHSTIKDVVNETMVHRLQKVFKEHTDIAHWNWNKINPGYLAFELWMHYAQTKMFKGNAESTADVSTFTRTGSLDLYLDKFLGTFCS